MPDHPRSAASDQGDELRRLAALYATGLLDEEAPADLRAAVAVAADLLGCPIAFLTLIDHDTVHARIASVGEAGTLARHEVPCNLVIADGPLVIDDLAADPRFAGGRFAAMGVRFYAGVPIHAPDRDGIPRPIGALCVTDGAPRHLGEREQPALARLGTVADALIAARAGASRAVALAVESDRLAATLAREHRVFAQAERLALIGSWRLALADERVTWSAGMYRVYGLASDGEPTLERCLAPYPPAARARVAACIAHSIETGEPFDFEEDFQPAGAPPRRIRCLGEREQVDGEQVALVGVFQDITDRHRLEQELRQAADTDALTGLVNRPGFERALEAAMARARRVGSPLVLALMDLDGFKAINDTLGHPAGDDVLRAIGRALRTDAPSATLAARLGGDEFAVLVENPALCADPDDLAARLETALRVPVGASGGLLSAAGTVGLAAFRPDDRAVRDLVHRADVALYAGKRARSSEGSVGERRRDERLHAA